MCLVLFCRRDADCVATRPGLGVCAGGGEVPHLLPDCRTCQVSRFSELLRSLMYPHRHMYTHTHKPSHTQTFTHTHTEPPPHTHTHTHTQTLTHTHTNPHIHTHMHTNLHIHTHTHNLSFSLFFIGQRHICAPVPMCFHTFPLTLPSSHPQSKGSPPIKTWKAPLFKLQVQHSTGGEPATRSNSL